MLFTPKYTVIVYEELYQQKADHLMRESGFRVRGAIESGGHEGMTLLKVF